MKKLLYITLSLILVFGVASCDNWLDVNTNPDSPNNFSATVDVRLPWIQYYYMYAWGTTNARVNGAAQIITGTSRTSTVGRLSLWNPNQTASVTMYQNWFVGAAANIPDIINRAQEEGAYHYEAAALVVKSMGYMMMADLYGEMPYEQAVTADFSPAFSTGEQIFDGCIADLDRAIELFQTPQEQGATPLSAGDTWNGGNTDKWIKLCYGLKARWLNNLSKTERYDPQAILTALQSAPQSNADNTKMTHYNVESATTNVTVGDAYGPCVTWDVAAWGTGQRLARYYAQLLTNFKGTGVEDPRADKMLPSSMYKVRLSSDKSRIESYEWLRDEGVDLSGIDEGWTMNRLQGGNLNGYLTLAMEDDTQTYAKEDIEQYYESVDAFIAVLNKYYTTDNITIKDTQVEVEGENGNKEMEDVIQVTYHPGAMYVNDDNPLYVEDIKYVQLRADAVFETQGLAVNDMNCYYTAVPDNSRELGFVQGTGTFYTRPDSDSDILTYTEMLFIKAEVLFRQGDAQGAYNAYRDAILSHFERMNEKLKTWTDIGCGKTARGFDVSFAYSPMSQAEIDAYMASAAVKQDAASLTLSDIMMQKLIAMCFNYQSWNDMKRYNYFAGNIGSYGVIYTEMAVPAYRTGDFSTFSTDPQSDQYQLRRLMQPSFETDYNSTECNASVAPYAATYGISNALDYKIYSVPVWWDVTR